MRCVNGWWIPDAHPAGDVDPVESQWVEANEQIRMALAHVPGRRMVLQAGARVGLWPKLLHQAGFEHVVAFEPDEANHACAMLNLEDELRIVQAIPPAKMQLFHGALGRRKRYAFLERSALSDGEHFIALDQTSRRATRVRMYAIDGLGFRELDAIFLDVEGYELEALAGAEETLKRFRPVLVLEENIHCHRYGIDRGDLERWLKPRGYRLVAEYSKLPPAKRDPSAFQGSDLIFAPT